MHPTYRLIAFLCILTLTQTETIFGQWRVIDTCSKNDTAFLKNRFESIRFIQQEYQDQINNGYLNCRIDTTSVDSTYRYCMTKGSRYVIDSIIIALPDNSKHVKTFKTPSTEAFSILNIVTVKEELKSYSENGYPFVNLSLDDIHWKDSVASIRWHIEKGPLMKMDSLYLRSDDRIPRAYLTRALQWQKGKHYRESIIQQADGRIREIPFLSNLQPSSLRFTADGAQLITYPVRKPSNTFQGILGIRPDDRTGKINLTGDVELRLWNGLNTGEELYINWRKLQSQTQDLEAKVVFNYLFGTSFGPETNIKIYKRDSTFVSIRLNGGIGWKPNFHTTLKGFAERLNTNTLRPSLLFPEVTNVSAVYYGISYIHSAYDNIGNPRKGILIRGEISRGYRTKEIYNAADSSNISNRYDAAKYELEMKLYIPTFKKQCLLMGTYSGSIQSDSLAQNELYRIGGIRTMRGIDEESILTSSFSITTVEYRYLLDTQTAVYLFMEHSWWENRSDLKYIKDSPISFGAGLNLKTSSGIFTFNYALGQQFNNPVQVRNAKVSFGFKSVF